MLGYLFINGLIFLIVGLRALLKPTEAVAIPYSLEGHHVDAKNYLRSAAGGVTIACALVQLAAPFYQPLQLPALVLVVTVLGGLVAGRLFSMIVDGVPGLVPLISGSLELVGFVLGVYWLHDLGGLI